MDGLDRLTRFSEGRQLPDLAELKSLLRFRAPILDPVRRGLSAALSVDELRAVAVRTTPRSVFEYVDGGSDREITVDRNRAAFDSVEFVPEYLSPVADPDLSTTLLGREVSLPLVMAPTGYTRMMHHDGECAVAAVAASAGIPYTLSTVGTATLEEVAGAAPGGDNWFQLYLTRDQGINEMLLERARAAGGRTIMLTVDTPVAAHRLRDVRNGLTIPPTLTPKTIAGMARHPMWALNKLTTAPITFASLAALAGGAVNAVDVADIAFEPTLSYRHLDWLRSEWEGDLLVKGVLSPRTAAEVVGHGADGVIVSNHGGRQLDRAPATLSVLPEIREAVGPEVAVLLDSGVRHGADIIAAVARGADAVMIGRAYLYGLMAGGRAGVERVVEILREEYARSLQLLGLASTAGIRSSHVRLPDPASA